MAGFVPPPINVAKGATKGRLFTGTDPDRATWQPLPVQPNGGSLADPSATLSALLSALEGAGVELPAITGWNKSFPGAERSLWGWYVRYSSDNVVAASPGLKGGEVYPDVASNPIYDPLARGVSGSLFFRTGAGPRLWPSGAKFITRWRNANNLDFTGSGTIAYSEAEGDLLTFGTWISTTTGNWVRPVTHRGVEVTDSANVPLHKTYQP